MMYIYPRKPEPPVENLNGFLLNHKDHVENINVNFEDLACKPGLRDMLLTLPDATITTSFPNNLEIGGSTTSKAEALRQLGKKPGIRREEMLAAGDSPNDIAMLQEAGIAVAMGNGEEEVKSVADYITSDNDHDGVGEAVENSYLKCKFHTGIRKIVPWRKKEPRVFFFALTGNNWYIIIYLHNIKWIQRKG